MEWFWRLPAKLSEKNKICWVARSYASSGNQPWMPSRWKIQAPDTSNFHGAAFPGWRKRPLRQLVHLWRFPSPVDPFWSWPWCLWTSFTAPSPGPRTTRRRAWHVMTCSSLKVYHCDPHCTGVFNWIQEIVFHSCYMLLLQLFLLRSDIFLYFSLPMQAGSHAARKLCRGRVELRPAWTPALRWRLLSVALAKSGPPLPQKSPKQLRHNSWRKLKEGVLFLDICQCERLNSVSWAGAVTVCCNPLQSLAYLACELFRWQPRDRIRGPSWGGLYPSRQLWLHKGQVM